MKKIVFILALFPLLLAACGGTKASQTTANPAKATKRAEKQTQAAEATKTPKIRVDARCTLDGKPADTTVTQGTDVLLYWEWIASTQDQAQAGIDQSQISVTLDGQPVGNVQVKKIAQTSDGKYNVTWWANAGVLPAGAHTLTYSASWKSQITDGTNTYGPGGTVETQSDTCTITVQ